jgi:hypothetical protein
MQIAPDGLRGRVRFDASPSGGAYAIVSDGTRFAVLRTTTSLRAMQGKLIVISRDPKGRLVVGDDPGWDRGR